MSRIKLVRLNILIFSFLFTSVMFCNGQNYKTEVLVIYPHFFKNTRTLIKTIDSIYTKSDSTQLLLFISNEYNPTFYFGKDGVNEVKNKLSYMSGNLVPDFKYDIDTIINHSLFKDYLANEDLNPLSFHFFIPGEYLEFWNNNKDKFRGLAVTNEFGIIPKYLIVRDQVAEINIYFPQQGKKYPKTTINGIEVIQKII